MNGNADIRLVGNFGDGTTYNSGWYSNTPATISPTHAYTEESAQPGGFYTWKFRAETANGNVSSWILGYIYIDDSPPELVSSNVSPGQTGLDPDQDIEMSFQDFKGGIYPRVSAPSIKYSYDGENWIDFDYTVKNTGFYNVQFTMTHDTWLYGPLYVWWKIRDVHYSRCPPSDQYKHEVSDIWQMYVGIPESPPTVFSLVSPTNNASDVCAWPTFTWEASTDPDGGTIWYTVYCSQSVPEVALFSPQAIIGQFITGTSFTLQGEEGLHRSGTYYWRVVARDDEGDTMPTIIWKFTVEPTVCTRLAEAIAQFQLDTNEDAEYDVTVVTDYSPTTAETCAMSDGDGYVIAILDQRCV
jgi:hypothetical protein